MEIPSRGLALIAVALSTGHVLVYNDKNVVDCFKMDTAVSAMKFGKFGREDNTLVLVTVREAIKKASFFWTLSKSGIAPRPFPGLRGGKAAALPPTRPWWELPGSG